MVLEKIGEKALSSANSLRSEVNDFGKSFTYIYIFIYMECFSVKTFSTC